MTSLPPFDGPHMVHLLDGRVVFEDTPDAVHEREAKAIAELPQRERDERLFDIERERGVEVAARMRKTIEEVISVVATRSA